MFATNSDWLALWFIVLLYCSCGVITFGLALPNSVFLAVLISIQRGMIIDWAANGLSGSGFQLTKSCAPYSLLAYLAFRFFVQFYYIGSSSSVPVF